MQCTLWTERSAHDKIASCATNVQHAARRPARIQQQQYMRNYMYDKNIVPKHNILTQETKQMSANFLVWLFCVATPMKNEPGPIESGALNLRSAFVESAEQARCSSTSGGLPRPEPGRGQPTPPYKTAAQFSRSLSRSSFSCARLRLVHATAHANANDLSTPAVE